MQLIQVLLDVVSGVVPVLQKYLTDRAAAQLSNSDMYSVQSVVTELKQFLFERGLP